jgi:hypothetical protein
MRDRPDNAALRVGHYELLRELARGGMATVHEARHVHLDTRVAVKRMLPTLSAGDGTLGARFRNEALAATRIRHPNVVRIHDYGVDEVGFPYLAMELLEGATLGAALATEGPLSIARAIDLFLATVSGVFAVHGAGYVHRDLKPRNIFLHCPHHQAALPVVIDFGVAKRLDEDGAERASGLTESGVVLGTAAYMAPEQILSSRTVGPAADQYALAVTMYECLTGSLPYSGSCPSALMSAALTARVRRVRDLRPDVPSELDDVVHRAMQRDPRDRFPSLHAMGEALLPLAGPGAALGWRAEVTRAQEGLSGRSGGTGSGETGALVQTRSHRRRTASGSGARAATLVLVAGAVAACGAFLRTQDSRQASVNSRPPAPVAERAGAVQQLSLGAGEGSVGADSVHAEPAGIAHAEPAVFAQAKAADIAQAKAAGIAHAEPTVFVQAKAAGIAQAKPAGIAQAKPADSAHAEPATIPPAAVSARPALPVAPPSQVVSPEAPTVGRGANGAAILE